MSDERFKLARIIEDLAAMQVVAADPHKFMWLIKAQGDLVSAATQLCMAELKPGACGFFLEWSRNNLQSAIAYLGRTADQGGPTLRLQARVRELLARVPSATRRSSIEND